MPREDAGRMPRLVEALNVGVADVDEEAERILLLVRTERENLAKTIAEFDGHQLPMGVMERLDMITKIFNTVTMSINRLDATRERRAKKMKKGDFLEAATKLIQSLGQAERGYWLKNMIRFHRRAAGQAIREESLASVDRIPEDHDSA